MKRRIRICTLTPPVLLLFIFNTTLFISLAFAYDASASVPAVLTLVQLSLAGLLVGVFLINFWDVCYMNLLAKTLCWVTFVSGLTVITDYLGLTSFKNLYLDREIVRQIGILGEPNFAAGKLAIGFPFLIWGFLETVFSGRFLSAMVYATGCVLIIVAVFLTGSRMGVLMLVISLALVAFKERNRLLRPRIVMIGGLLAAVLFFLLRGPFAIMFNLTVERVRSVLMPIGTGQGLGEPSAQMRVAMLKAGWDIFREHPIFGVGMNGYGSVLPFYSPWLGSIGSRYAHNTFMEILTGTGLLGFVPFTGLIVFVMKRMWRGWEREEKTRLPFYFALSFIMMTVHLFFLSDYSNRYLWGIFLPLSIYLEWLDAQWCVQKQAICKSQ